MLHPHEDMNIPHILIEDGISDLQERYGAVTQKTRETEMGWTIQEKCERLISNLRTWGQAILE